MLLSVRQRRAYSPTAPVYARDNLTFLGRPVARGEQVPEEYFSSKRHRLTMWRFRKVAHVKGGTWAKPVAELPVAVPETQSAVEAAIEAVAEADSEAVTAVTPVELEPESVTFDHSDVKPPSGPTKRKRR